MDDDIYFIHRDLFVLDGVSNRVIEPFVVGLRAHDARKAAYSFQPQRYRNYPKKSKPARRRVNSCVLEPVDLRREAEIRPMNRRFGKA